MGGFVEKNIRDRFRLIRGRFPRIRAPKRAKRFVRNVTVMQETFDPDSAAAWQVRIFKKSFAKKAMLRNLQKLMAPVEGKTCLDVGGGNGVVSWMLRRNGGGWVSAASSDMAMASMGVLLGEEQVFRIEGAELPFEDQTFDVIVVIDYLMHIREDALFLRECHRCLKPRGELVIHVSHVKSFSVVRGLRKLIGLTDEKRGRVRPGYRLRDLYEISKDGFDIVESHTYSGVFVELIDTMLQKFAGSAVDGIDTNEKNTDQQVLRRFARSHQTHALAYPFLKLAAGLDVIFSFTRNHKLVIKARPRPWIQRKSVKLRDGRSIAEAAIQTKIGSAAELVKPLPGG